MKTHFFLTIIGFIFFLMTGCSPEKEEGFITISKDELKDKIKGAWAAQTIGCTYGGPTEFRYRKAIIPDSIEIQWSDSMMHYWMTKIPGLYDDIYMDLTFVDVFQKEGLDASASLHAKAYAEAEYMLWHANQQGRYNILHGIMPPESGHWLNNPHADDIDFQIEADFAGIMAPGMLNSAAKVCDKIGHIMNYGDGYYGGVLVAGMYSAAFIENDIKVVVDKGLTLIPKEAPFYQCIADVISWNKQYPTDWKHVWWLVEEKWGEDVGCPDGAAQDFNIDAKLNSAYVVMGLLYGEGNFEKTMEISTRCGQDSDCNPATAAGVLGTMIGYNKIPEKWSKGLAYIEDMDFKYTTMSLNTTYKTSFEQALGMIERGGGLVSETEVKIKVQDPIAVPLEVSFPGYKIAELREIGKQLSKANGFTYETEFEGIGAVLGGRMRNLDFMDVWMLSSDEETLNDTALKLNVIIDGELVKTVEMPLRYIIRNLEVLHVYELNPGKHTLKIEAVDPHEKMVLDLGSLLVYTK
ncbi:ADP-ribosylglycohydrolase family protein [Bacteroidota bacterium]